jgi:hypothetical protein
MSSVMSAFSISETQYLSFSGGLGRLAGGTMPFSRR